MPCAWFAVAKSQQKNAAAQNAKRPVTHRTFHVANDQTSSEICTAYLRDSFLFFLSEGDAAAA